MDLSFLEGLTRRELLQWIENHIQGDPLSQPGPSRDARGRIRNSILV